MSSKIKVDIIDLLPDPAGLNKPEAELMESLRWLTLRGCISTTQAWSFFSTGGTPPNIKIESDDSRQTIRQKKIAVFIFKRLATGNNKKWEYLKNETKTHLITREKRLCAYCRRQLYLHGFSFNIDHIYPKSPLAQDSYSQQEARRLCFKLENLVASCVDCNTVKRNKLHQFNPNLCDYADYMNYKIIISNEFCVTYHRADARPSFNHIGEELYQVFGLDRHEHRAILSSLGDDTAIRKMEAALMLSEERDELAERIRDIYEMLIDTHIFRVSS